MKPHRQKTMRSVLFFLSQVFKVLFGSDAGIPLEKQDERRGRCKTGALCHFFHQLPLSNQFFRMVQLCFFDLIRDFDAGIQPIKPGQVGRIEPADARKGCKGKVIAFNIIIDVTVNPPDDGLGAVGFVFLPLQAGIGTQGGKLL